MLSYGRRGKYTERSLGIFFWEFSRQGGSCSVTGKIGAADGEVSFIHSVHDHVPESRGHGLEVRGARAKWLTALREKPRLPITETILEQRRE